MNIMSLDAAYGDGTINDMHTVPGLEEPANSNADDHHKRVPLNPKIRPMEQLHDNVLNLSGFSKLTPPTVPVQQHQQHSPQRQPSHQNHGPNHGEARDHRDQGHDGYLQSQVQEAAGPEHAQGHAPHAPHAPPRALPHPREFLNSNSAFAPSDQLLETQLQDKLLEQYQVETVKARADAVSSQVPRLRSSSGGGSRFEKYGDNNNGGGGGGDASESSLAAFYSRNKIVILVVGSMLCVLMGVLIWVLVCHRKKKAADALMYAVTPTTRASQHFGTGVPGFVGDPVSWDGSVGSVGSVLNVNDMV